MRLCKHWEAFDEQLSNVQTLEFLSDLIRP